MLCAIVPHGGGWLQEEKVSMGGVQGAGMESLHRMHSIRHGGLNGPQACATSHTAMRLSACRPLA